MANSDSTHQWEPVHAGAAGGPPDSFSCDEDTILASLQCLLRQADVRRLTIIHKSRPLAEFHVMPDASPAIRSSIVVAATDLVLFVKGCSVHVERETPATDD